jgi:RNA polymerase sigma factor (sigma-70 family)
VGTPLEFGDAGDDELVVGVLSGNRDAFAAVYDRYADRLHDFCWSLLRDRDEAADAVQDVFVLAAQRLGQLRDPAKLRPWLYSVARSTALRRIRGRARLAPESEVVDMADTTTDDPEQAAEQSALRDLVWNAAAGLSDRDRALLDLHLRQGLDGAELGEAMGVSANNAYVMLTRLRTQVERSLGALLVAKLGRADCPELDELLREWDGRFSPLIRKRVARHVDNCELCGAKRRTVVSPLALLSAVPVLPAPEFIRERVLGDIALMAMPTPLPPRTGTKYRALVAAAVLLFLGGGVAYVVWPRESTLQAPLTQQSPSAVPTSSLPSTTTSGSGTASSDVTTTVTTTTTTTTTTTSSRSREPVVTSAPGGDTRPPVVADQVVSPTTVETIGCKIDRASVGAVITDESPLKSVLLSWQSPQGKPGSMQMTTRDGRWFGSLGPFDTPGEVVWQVTATDASGNSTTGPAQSLRVITCPVIS